MQIEYGKEIKSFCILCDKHNQSCRTFRIVENNSLPPIYRTLYNFKCAICLDCINSGQEYLTKKIERCMDEYIGGCDEMLRSCGLQPRPTGS